MKNNNIKQILLLGCDVTKSSDSSNNHVFVSQKYMRSDTIIVAFINQETKKISLVSFVRDIWINIEGHGEDRINTAICKGGPKLLMKLLNKYFDLDIKNYIILNMENLVKIVDQLGGIDINLNDEEVYYINEEINDVRKITGYSKEVQIITNTGVNHLNGLQTLTHVRNRLFGYCWKRTERQREVLKAMFYKIKQLNSKEKILFFGMRMIKYVKTNLSLFTIIDLAKIATKTNIQSIKTYCIPAEGTYNMENDGVWRLEIDYIENSIKIKEILRELV